MAFVFKCTRAHGSDARLGESLPVSLPFVNAIIASDPRVARATTTMAVLGICAVSSPF